MKKRTSLMVVIGMIVCLLIGFYAPTVNGQTAISSAEAAAFREKSGLQLANLTRKTVGLIAFCRDEAVRVQTETTKQAIPQQTKLEENAGLTAIDRKESEQTVDLVQPDANQPMTQNAGICNGMGHWNEICDGSCTTQGNQPPGTGICDGTGNHAANCAGTCSYYNQRNAGDSPENNQNQNTMHNGAMRGRGYHHGGNQSSSHGTGHRR
ncbi:hypothetical protein IW492_12000 [Enterococcus sp. BWB1-3]|uniref:hypothetical protein n=1 Tax=Enterococcus sp. BWB1-3 TaxID=2787713 RepID=UPI001923FCE5|nr:hypothetical protein [Enterococcus sp. BWB1-3]MBL1229956.1 hypothetical protein [Enterococcus sp. BWB1-3]